MTRHLEHAELFMIPEESGKLIVYAPLHGIALRLEPSQVNCLARLRHGQATPDDLNSRLLGALQAAGLDEPPAAGPPLCRFSAGQFSPAHLTLFLTTACNLRCVYCYAHGDHPVITMPVDLGKAAIAELFRFAREAGRKRVDLGFHGGGEPTCAWHELTALVGYARELEEETGIECGYGLATNGVLTGPQAAWIGKHFDNVNLSLDGPPRIHDRQRPRANGGPSSAILRRTMRELEKANCRYVCQATVSAETMSTMPETVRYVSRHTKAAELKFEPVMPDGRFRHQDASVPPAETFAACFDAAHALGLQRGLNVMFSALRIFGPPLSCFCGAFDTPFGVTPDGFVSACYETFVASCDHRDTFFFGRYDPARRRFDIDHDVLARLRRRQIANLPTCSGCFCKYTCAGDCASRNFHYFSRQDLFAVGARCELIRAVLRRHLQRLLNASERGHVATLYRGNPSHGKEEQTHVRGPTCR